MTEPRDHFANPPQRRIGALGIVRNLDGHVLFVEKKEAPPEHPVPFYLPGGCVEEDEFLLDGLVRAARRKLGVDLVPGRLLAVHQMHEKDHGSHVSKEGYNLLFDCGVWERDPEFELGPDVARARWVAPDDMRGLLMTFTAERVEAALRSLSGGDVEVLRGH